MLLADRADTEIYEHLSPNYAFSELREEGRLRESGGRYHSFRR